MSAHEPIAQGERVLVLANAQDAYAYWAASLAACREELDAALALLASREQLRDLTRARRLRREAAQRAHQFSEEQASSSRPTWIKPLPAQKRAANG